MKNKTKRIGFSRQGADVLISYLDDVEGKDAQDTANYVEEAGNSYFQLRPCFPTFVANKIEYGFITTYRCFSYRRSLPQCDQGIGRLFF